MGLSYVLIATALYAGYGTHPVHVEHDYPTRETCQKAYEIFEEQTRSTDGTRVKVTGACLYTGPRGADK